MEFVGVVHRLGGAGGFLSVVGFTLDSWLMVRECFGMVALPPILLLLLLGSVTW